MCTFMSEFKTDHVTVWYYWHILNKVWCIQQLYIVTVFYVSTHGQFEVLHTDSLVSFLLKAHYVSEDKGVQCPRSTSFDLESSVL